MIDWTALPDAMLRNYVCRYESGGVQPRPTLRFVDAEGRACLAAAFCGARTSADVSRAAAALGQPFHRGILEQVSRRFEAGRLSATEAYDACVLELAARRARRPAPPAPVASVPIRRGALTPV